MPNVATVGIGAFQNCKALTSISLPKATSINYNAFSSCNALTTICLPKDTNMRPTDLRYLRSVTTLFLCNGSDNTPATDEDIAKWADADAAPTLTTVFYDYQGEDGDYLDPNNYNQVWTRPSN